MEVWQAFVLGLVQGLAEFLPISSSGHLLLAREIMGIDGDYLLYDVLLHVGTLFAVVLYFRKDVASLFVPPFTKMGLIIVASIPAVVVGVIIKIVSNEFALAQVLFESGKYLGWFFLITALINFVSEYLGKRQTKTRPFGIKSALSMGLMQAVGVLPGVSRSGSTILGGLISKAEKSEVATFSFLMSLPIILGSAFIESVSVITSGSNTVNVWSYLVGMGASFISGFIAVNSMMSLIKKANLKWFGVYLLAISAISFTIF